jgi:anti-sigma regulatory factor (Ser/Thr protein kinase)
MTSRPRVMPLSSRVVGPPGHPVLVFSGSLTASSVGELISALHKVIQERPETVVADLTDVRIANRVYLTSLITVGHEAAAWPGCRVALCVTDPDTRSVLRNLRVDRQMLLCRDPDEAQSRLTQLRPASRLREQLLPTLESVDLARRRTHDICTQWGLTDVEGQVQSVVTELVTNAVIHAGTAIELSYALSPPFLHVAVRDQSDARPRRRTGDDERGYGLTLVDAFARHWGHHPTSNGKVVWAAIRLTPRPGRRPPAEPEGALA